MVKRPVILRDEFAIVPLTRGLHSIIDLQDAEIVSEWDWALKPVKSLNGYGYASRKKWHNGRQYTIYLHRFILGAPEGVEVDHIDGDTLNNRRANLRLATRTQNLANTKTPVTNSSGYKGVSWDINRRKWSAKIGVNGRCVNIGRFENLEDAAAAYQQFALKVFGEFARFK